MKCGMIVSVCRDTGEQLECPNEPAVRGGLPIGRDGIAYGVCSECAKRMIDEGDFTWEELDREYPPLEKGGPES